jgi:hypothetical protein
MSEFGEPPTGKLKALKTTQKRVDRSTYLMLYSKNSMHTTGTGVTETEF